MIGTLKEIAFSPYAVGVYLGLGALGVSYLRYGKEGFKKTYEPAFGKRQVSFETATFEKALIRYIRQPKKDSKIKLITNNFPSNEWNRETLFYNWIKNQLDRGVEIEVYGGPNIGAKKELKELKEDGLKIHLLAQSQTEHYTLFSDPKQIWAEEHHVDGDAKNCFFTDKPLPEIIEEIEKHMSGLPKNNISIEQALL